MKRRKFIENISLGTVGITFVGLPKNLYSHDENAGSQKDVLKMGFLNPPESAKPQTWWHWREGRINPVAITAELEAMKRIGLGGVTMFSASRMGETGPDTPCLSAEWHECVKHALKECDRLGLTFNFQNCAGWSGSGGPCITPDKNMMRIVYAKHIVEGGATLKLEAPPSWPEKGNTYYRDIALLAYPMPESIKFEKLDDWSKRPEKAIKYYSGLAVYSTSFNWNQPVSKEIYLDLGRVEVIAEVKLNGKECGIVWTPPYRVDISEALQSGENQLEIRVANTWLNRLMGDGLRIDMGSEKHTWTTCNPFTVDPELTVPEISTRSMLAFKDLKREPVPSGLLGPVRIWEL